MHIIRNTAARLTAPAILVRLAAAFLLATTLSGATRPATAAPAPAKPTPTKTAPSPQADFASADDAAQALVAALTAGDEAKLRDILGPGSEKLIHSGDDVADREARDRFVEAYTAKHQLVPGDGGTTVVQVGDNDWPLPIPLVSANGRWRFDTATAGQEIVDRRIGRNEIAAIGVLFALVDAEKDYFARATAGAGQYAQHIVSDPGKHDGLYWDAADGEDPSPLAKLVEKAAEEGYPSEPVKGHREPYQGYYFRILKAQGNYATEGARAYIKDGRMTGGLAFIAWPAEYGASGITTFMVNQDRIVFQKDLGPNTEARVSTFTKFDPDLTWARVDVVDR